MKTTINLGELVPFTDTLDIRCRLCARHGRYRVAKLVAQYGAQMPIPSLLTNLVGDCPQRLAQGLHERCSPYAPDLVRWFGRKNSD